MSESIRSRFINSKAESEKMKAIYEQYFTKDPGYFDLATEKEGGEQPLTGMREIIRANISVSAGIASENLETPGPKKTDRTGD